MSFIFEPTKLLLVNNNIPNNSKIKESNNIQKIENESEKKKKMNNFFIENQKKQEHNKDNNYFNKTKEAITDNQITKSNSIKRGFKRKFSSRSNILCVDIDSQKNESKKEINEKDINELNNELKSDSIDDKKKNNYLGFELKEKNIFKRKGDEGGGFISLLNIYKNGNKNSFKTINKYKYIMNIKKKTNDNNMLKIPIKGKKTKILFEEKLNRSQIINIKIKDYKNINNKEDKKALIEEYKNENLDNDKDEIIKNLKSENDNLKKVANENYSLLNRLKELEKIKKEDNLKLDEMNKENEQMKIKYNLLKFKNESINNSLKKLKEGIEKYNKEKKNLKKEL